MNKACTIDSIKFPKYIIELLSRSDWEETDKRRIPGLTIRVYKRTPYANVDTLKKECEKLINWANREVPHPYGMSLAYIVDVPNKTHYRPQYAIMVIYDPIMLRIEQLNLLKGENKL